MIFRRAPIIAAALLSIVAGTSCSTAQYAYLPAGVNADRAQRGRAYYQVPSDHPTGTVQVMSSGITKLKPSGGGPEIPALHLRMVVSNQASAVPWVLDPHGLSVSFPNVGARTQPVFIQSKSPTTPNLVVAQGEMKTLDLYFALPEAEMSAGQIPEFDFRWQIQAGEKPVLATTSFDRVTIDYYAYGYPNYYGYPYYSDGYGSPGWWDGAWWG